MVNSTNDNPGRHTAYSTTRPSKKTTTTTNTTSTVRCITATGDDVASDVNSTDRVVDRTATDDIDVDFVVRSGSTAASHAGITATGNDVASDVDSTDRVVDRTATDDNDVTGSTDRRASWFTNVGHCAGICCCYRSTVAETNIEASSGKEEEEE